MQALWNVSIQRFGTIDIWINNAALAHQEMNIHDLPYRTIRNVINANIVGTVNGCHVAINEMAKQGHGHVFNVDGWGSNGMVAAGRSMYGMSKAAVTYLTKALRVEAKHLPVHISTISPGMVVTDLMMTSAPDNKVRFRQIMNIMGDRVETVSPYLAEHILHAETNTTVSWMNPLKLLMRFLVAPFNKRDVFAQSPR